MDDINLNKKIGLMKPVLPPFDEFQAYFEKIWETRYLTNDGSIHKEFEQALCNYLGVKYISLFANGTLALLTALKALNLEGEVITTPFTWVATANAIYWNNLKPVFVDIDERDFNIDPSQIEKAITPKTCAILPVHIFGNPCNTDAIDHLAKTYKLKVIYDGAHAFGVKIKEESIYNFGDLSVLSFHSTKVFNTFEGGAIVCHNQETKTYIDALKNNGLGPDNELIDYGLNAKMNEMQAAFGLVQLKYIDDAISLRKAATDRYHELLKGVKGIGFPTLNEGIKYNYSYLPIIIHAEEFGASRDELLHFMEKNNIYPKTYFHPLVSDYKLFSNYKSGNLEVARKLSDNILCLPLYHDITEEEISRVVGLIGQTQK